MNKRRGDKIQSLLCVMSRTLKAGRGVVKEGWGCCATPGSVQGFLPAPGDAQGIRCGAGNSNSIGLREDKRPL